jgi:hypothetical protein
MIISDELFDYREAMMETAMREQGLSETMIRRWGAIHELFRRAIVKSSARGLVVDGEERAPKDPEDVVVEFATMCDGCHSEMPVGTKGRFHPEDGRVYCAACTAVPA